MTCQSSIFHLIDSKTSYKPLLRRDRKINSDVKLFTTIESHFANSKFFEEDFTPKEMMMTTISSTKKGDSKVVKEAPTAMGHNGLK